MICRDQQESHPLLWAQCPWACPSAHPQRWHLPMLFPSPRELSPYQGCGFVTSSQPRSSHKTTQRVLALMTLLVFAKLHLSQTETPPDPAHCQQVPRAVSIPWSHSVWVKPQGPLGTGRWPGEEGFAPRCSSRGRDGPWHTGTPQPCCSSGLVSDFLPLCFISSRLWALR